MLSSKPAAPAPLQPYTAHGANDAGMRTIALGTLVLCGLLALAAIIAWNDRSHLAPVDQRTRLDLPARECPAPQIGQVLTVTVARLSQDQFATGCRMIKGRSA
jgi:hypothetical protein